MGEANTEAVGGAIGARSRKAVGDALARVRPDAARDAAGYVVELEDNFLPGITRADIEKAFGAGAGQELEGKMRAPWSSSALAVNSFAPWAADPVVLAIASRSGFTKTPSSRLRPGERVPRRHLPQLVEQKGQLAGELMFEAGA
jgi:hypothetical protein